MTENYPNPARPAPRRAQEALDALRRDLARVSADMGAARASTADIGDARAIDSGSLRPDRRATLQGSEIIGHLTRASFMRATGKGQRRSGLRVPAPIPAGISAREAIDGLRRAWGVSRAEGLTQ